MKQSPQEAQRVRSLMPQVAPELWASLYPRGYADSGRWHSPRRSAENLMAAVMVMRGDPNMARLDPVGCNVAYVAEAMAAHGMPTFFVHPALLQAVLHTDAPDNFTFAELAWPFPALRFILPRGGLSSPVDGEIMELCVARTAGATDIQVVVASHSENDTTFSSRLLAQPSDPLTVVAADPTISSLGFLNENGQREALAAADSAILLSLRSIAFRLLMMMQFCPEHVQAGRQIRPASTNPRKPGSALWSPNEIGRNYALHNTSGESTESVLRAGRHPRAHWRRGHWRNQRHGAGNQLIRRLLIDPIYVGNAVPATASISVAA